MVEEEEENRLDRTLENENPLELLAEIIILKLENTLLRIEHAENGFITQYLSTQLQNLNQESASIQNQILQQLELNRELLNELRKRNRGVPEDASGRSKYQSKTAENYKKALDNAVADNPDILAQIKVPEDHTETKPETQTAELDYARTINKPRAETKRGVQRVNQDLFADFSDEEEEPQPKKSSSTQQTSNDDRNLSQQMSRLSYENPPTNNKPKPIPRQPNTGLYPPFNARPMPVIIRKMPSL